MALNSQRRHEGYLLIDNRVNEGVPDEVMRAAFGADIPANAGRGVFETATYSCSHCQAMVIIHPLRTRERAYCPKCDRRICDACGALRALSGGACVPFDRLLDQVQEDAAKGRQSSPLILPSL